MEKSSSLTLDEAVQLLQGSEDDYTLGVESVFDIDEERLKALPDVKAQIDMVRSTQRQSVFTITRTEKQMGTLAFEDAERNTDLDAEHQDFLDRCRSMRDDIRTRIDRAVEVATEKMLPKPTGFFHFKQKKQWDEQSNMRLLAQKMLLKFDADFTRAALEAEEFIVAHMMFVRAGRTFPTFDLLQCRVLSEYCDVVARMKHMEMLLKMDHPEDPAYLKCRVTSELEAENEPTVSGDIVTNGQMRRS